MKLDNQATEWGDEMLPGINLEDVIPKNKKLNQLAIRQNILDEKCMKCPNRKGKNPDERIKKCNNCPTGVELQIIGKERIAMNPIKDEDELENEDSQKPKTDRKKDAMSDELWQMISKRIASVFGAEVEAYLKHSDKENGMKLISQISKIIDKDSEFQDSYDFVTKGMRV